MRVAMILGTMLGVVGTAFGADVIENFVWQGDHAATVHGEGTTVWWNADRWDLRGDTANLAVNGVTDEGEPEPEHGFFFHGDIHKALTANPRDGREANDVYVVGGDGSPGLGAMRLDYQSIVSARLRNPLLIAPGAPGIVTFFAPKFVTTGHWWEVAITPATRSVTAGEFTSIPGTNNDDGSNSAFADPFGTDEVLNRTPGSGHPPYQDSINVILTGYPDRPTCDGSSWRVRFGVRKTHRGVSQDFIIPVETLEDLPATDPAEKDHLYRWMIRFNPGRVTLLADLNEDGALETLGHYPVTVPWREVYVHLLGVAYQAGHHPQRECGYQGQTREDLVWRNVRVGPVKYAKTAVFPKENGTANVPRDTGWMSYDLRDLQRFGPPLLNVPQANEAAYDQYLSWLYCAGGETFACTNNRKGRAVNLSVNLPAAALTDLARAQFVYDIRGHAFVEGASSRVRLSVNGTIVAILPPGAVRQAGSQETQFVRKSIDIPPNLLVAGANTINLRFLNEPGEVYLDRLQLELSTAFPPQ